ncbi:hypothetical protein RchiOBHm_Chr3g0495541 [Rosa chinensis]|uniref:Uncharacterized protein n=1 Tax=Rosa chinensis TaxID=74649 RepID=A0A2P6RH92_ROSCH|nr:hypothetical protein RchiOBHm_Chr3g0495541 [Rosa chinensis]
MNFHVRLDVISGFLFFFICMSDWEEKETGLVFIFKILISLQTLYVIQYPT